jgi:hypothetical protein
MSFVHVELTPAYFQHIMDQSWLVFLLLGILSIVGTSYVLTEVIVYLTTAYKNSEYDDEVGRRGAIKLVPRFARAARAA